MTIHVGDCIEVMAGMDADSVDAVVTDPPYGLEFMGKEWDKPNGFDKRTRDNPGTVDGAYARLLDRGPMKYVAGHSFQAWCEAWGREALRVTRPGGYLLAFGGTRTHHRLVCGLEDAGWIIRDELDWIYASGFPKGRANLKPAHEPIVLARKPGPLRPLAIDECRIGTADGFGGGANGTSGFANGYERGDGFAASQVGRWPSNVLLSDAELFDTANPAVVGSGAVTDGAVSNSSPNGKDSGIYGKFGSTELRPGPGDSGGYSRFFIVPKADRADREPVLRGQLDAKGDRPLGISQWDGQTNGSGEQMGPSRPRENAHPTVKPTDLMRHLVRLVTPIGGTVLDCFLGSGSTAIAAEMEGFAWIGIEKEPEYVAIAEARLNGVQRGLGLDLTG